MTNKTIATPPTILSHILTLAVGLVYWQYHLAIADVPR